jgi:preprotein translocase subunit SecG
MQTVIIVIHLMIVAAMVGMILLQRSEGGGLGMGSTGGFLTSRGTANVLTRTTAILAAVFFVTSLSLSILAGWGRKPHSILEGTAPAGQQSPASNPAPLGSGGRGVLDQLRGQGTPSGQSAPPSPSAPAQPPPPQVPQSK